MTPPIRSDADPQALRPAASPDDADAGSDKSEALIGALLPYLRQRGYEAGDRLPSERDLARRFGVARHTLREALSALEAVRMLQRRPQAGIFLRSMQREASLDAVVLQADHGLPIDESEVAELGEFRMIMETSAIRLACERHDADDARMLDTVLADSRARLDAGQSLAEQDAQFHLAIFAAARNQFLLRAANSFYLASKARRVRYFADPANARRSLSQHRRLRDAIVARDVAAAMAILGQHIGAVERYWRGSLPDRADPPQTHEPPENSR